MKFLLDRGFTRFDTNLIDVIQGPKGRNFLAYRKAAEDEPETNYEKPWLWDRTRTRTLT